MRGFFTCGHFRLANEWLVTRYGADGGVDWALTPGKSVFEDSSSSKKDEEKVDEEKPEAGKRKKETVTEKIKKGLAAADGVENVAPEPEPEAEVEE